MDKICFWTQSGYYWMSNFEPVEITIDGQVWSSVEHYYQAQKFLDKNFQELIRQTKSPGKVKRLSNKNKDLIRPDWDSVKLQIMERALEEKFKNPIFKELLIKTDPLEILEDSPKDLFWGTGALHGSGPGQNHMGKLLMALRSKILSK